MLYNINEANKLVEYIQGYSDKLNISVIQKALDVALYAHRHQKRKSGLPYIVHPIAIATNLIQQNFDTPTIAAALLHDVIEDTEVTEQELRSQFSNEIVDLVIGVTKLSKINLRSKKEAKVENFRKFILAVTKDIRVLVVKIFDRLDNIRSIEAIPEIYKRKRIALETMQLYVPLAERLGFYQIKDELEDRCFFILEPIAYRTVENEINLFTKQGSINLDKISTEIKHLLSINNLDVIVEHRIKKPYSAWQKIKTQGASFNKIFDILGLRFKTKNVEDCYKVLYLLHTNYKFIQERFKDYISAPKSNGYKSLHTGLLYNDKVKLDIQIRTLEMHQFAENGIAAHWNYKNPLEDSADFSKYAWLQNFFNLINQDDLSSVDLFEYSQIELYSDQLFIFTPKGRLVVLPNDACVLDFAYSIHSNLGDTAVSAVIDGNKYDIFTRLQNGQVVDILTNDKQTPTIDWLNYVKTGIAKHSIKRYLNSQYNKRNDKKATDLLNYLFTKNGIEYSDVLLPTLLEKLNIKTKITFYDQLLSGHVKEEDIVKAMNIKTQEDLTNYNKYNYDGMFDVEYAKNKSMVILMPTCCYKLLGDPLLAVSIPGNRIEIHHSDCKLIDDTKFSNNLNIVSANWKHGKEISLDAKILMVINEDYVITSSILSVLSKRGVFIKHIDIKHSLGSFLELVIILRIGSKLKLEYLIKSFLLNKEIIKIERLTN